MGMGVGVNAASAGPSAWGSTSGLSTTGILAAETGTRAAAAGAGESSATATGSLGGRLPPTDDDSALPRPIADDRPEPSDDRLRFRRGTGRRRLRAQLGVVDGLLLRREQGNASIATSLSSCCDKAELAPV